MRRSHHPTTQILLAIAALPWLACAATPSPRPAEAALPPAVAERAEPVSMAQVQEMRLEISLSERRLYEYWDGELAHTWDVAVGQPGHPTPRGSYQIFQIDWNPDWTPPDSPWAAGADYTPPGHPDNPMGRARIMFDPPYTIHGTDVYESLGEAASHGSVRMGNEEVIGLAYRIMEVTGAHRSDDWFREVLEDPTTMHIVELPGRVPLVIRE